MNLNIVSRSDVKVSATTAETFRMLAALRRKYASMCVPSRLGTRHTHIYPHPHTVRPSIERR